jgi:MFS transporter, NNP family, nitrate/nitrite transporter
MLSQLFSFKGRYRILHLTWFAFFLTFVCWFNFVPFQTTWASQLGLTEAQIKTIGLCNIALTIPARIVIGMILDRYGPRITFSSLLVFAIIPCFATALSQDFNQLVMSRLLMGLVGAGFVVGIRMVSEWFPPKEIGLAEGIYGGWGNFGSFGAMSALPIIATTTSFMTAGALNWRLAIALSGIVSALYGFIYFANVQDTPSGKAFKRPKKSGGMEVTSVKSFWAYMLSNFGLIFALGLLTWRLNQSKFLTIEGMYVAFVALAALYAYQSYQAWQVNKELLLGKKSYEYDQRFKFSQVALLEYTYVTNFGSELVAITVLPPFIEKTFGLDPIIATSVVALYAFLNLVSRPSGGLISDRFGSRRWTMILVTLGIAFSYLILQGTNSSWSIFLAIVLLIFTAFFTQAGCGVTYSIVPLVKREITGQVAGNVGAYGNFGAVIYLTIYSVSDFQTLFQTMGINALICASLCMFFLQEPKDSFAEHHETEHHEEAEQTFVPIPGYKRELK